MKILHNILWILTALVLVSVSCEKEEPMPCDSEFIPYFSCKVDGEEWVAKTPFSIGGPVALEGYYNENTGSFYIKSILKDDALNIYEKINIYGLVNVNQKSDSKMIIFDADGDEQLGFHNLKGSIPCKGFYHDSLDPGILEISLLDNISREIEGTFSMTLINRNCTDSLMQITDGEFAFRY